MKAIIMQALRGLIALGIGLMISLFIIATIVHVHIDSVDVYSSSYPLAEQKERIDEQIDKLAASNGFDADMVKAAITTDALLQYNNSIVAWWQEALATNNWPAVPDFDETLLLSVFDKQLDVADYNKASFSGKIASVVKDKVFLAREGLITAFASKISVAKYINLLATIRPYCLYAVFALIVLMFICCIKQISLFIWFSGIAAWTVAVITFAAKWLVSYLGIQQTLSAFSAHFALQLDMILNNIYSVFSTTYSMFFIIGLLLMVAYTIVYLTIRKIKTVIEA